jgi:hypothetical protein
MPPLSALWEYITGPHDIYAQATIASVVSIGLIACVLSVVFPLRNQALDIEEIWPLGDIPNMPRGIKRGEGTEDLLLNASDFPHEVARRFAPQATPDETGNIGGGSGRKVAHLHGSVLGKNGPSA